MLILSPPDAEPLLLTGANDAQLFAYSVRRFQTVSFSQSLSHFVISLLICHLMSIDVSLLVLRHPKDTWSLL